MLRRCSFGFLQQRNSLVAKPAASRSQHVLSWQGPFPKSPFRRGFQPLAPRIGRLSNWGVRMVHSGTEVDGLRTCTPSELLSNQDLTEFESPRLQNVPILAIPQMHSQSMSGSVAQNRPSRSDLVSVVRWEQRRIPLGPPQGTPWAVPPG